MRPEIPREIGLLGGGGQSIELRGYCSASIRFCAVDQEFLATVPEEYLPIDIQNPRHEFVSLPVVVAVGAPGVKQQLVVKWPGDRFVGIVAEDATIAEDAEVGKGSVVAPGARVMSRVTLGEHVLVNSNVVVSHETRVGDYSTISPGVAIGGRCSLGEGVFIGIGATVSDGVRIGAGAVVGAGAAVIEDVQPNEVVVGVPARHLRYETEWLRAI